MIAAIYARKSTDDSDRNEDAAQRNAGVLYATDGTMPNPWDRLPPYWMASSER